MKQGKSSVQIKIISGLGSFFKFSAENKWGMCKFFSLNLHLQILFIYLTYDVDFNLIYFKKITCQLQLQPQFDSNIFAIIVYGTL